MNKMQNKSPGSEVDWGDVRKAAQRYGLSVDWFNSDRITRKVGVPFVRVGRRCLYHFPTVDAFLAERMVRGDHRE